MGNCRSITETKQAAKRMKRPNVQPFLQMYKLLYLSFIKQCYVCSAETHHKYSLYLRTTAQCKFKGCCTYKFSPKRRPKPGKTVKVRVTRLGEIGNIHTNGIRECKREGRLRKSLKKKFVCKSVKEDLPVVGRRNSLWQCLKATNPPSFEKN